MKEIIIRAADNEDVAAIEQLEKVSFPADRRSARRSLRRSLDSDSQSVWLAESPDHSVVGAMVLHHRSRSIRVYSIAVNPQFRGSGVGRMLMEKAFALAAEARLSRVSLEADSGNRRLIGWYADMGFVIKARLADYYSPGCSAVRMIKDMRSTLTGGCWCGCS